MNVDDDGREKIEHLSADQENELRGLVPEFEPVKNGGGDGDSAKNKGAPDAESIQMMSLLYAGVFGLLAARLGDHWALSEAELQSIAAPTAAVVQKYLPDAQMGVEAALVVSLMVVVVPRLMVKPPIDGEVEDGDKSQHFAQ